MTVRSIHLHFRLQTGNATLEQINALSSALCHPNLDTDVEFLSRCRTIISYAHNILGLNLEAL